MSWGCVLLRLPPDLPAGVDFEWPADLVVPPVGPPAEIEAALSAAFPGQRHQGGQSAVETPDGLVLLDYDSCDDDGLATYVGVTCGGSAAAMEAIRLACEALGLRGLDSQTGQILDFGPATAESAKAFRDFRDRALGGCDQSSQA